VRATACGLVVALSLTVRVPLLAPVAEGSNCTLTVQLAAAARLDPQVVADCRKSPAFVPVNVKLRLVSVLDRLFFTVTVSAALVVPTVWLANVRAAGVTETGTTPVPVRLTVWGLFDAPSVIVTVAAYEEAAVGENVKLMVHEAWPFKVAPQVVADCVKLAGLDPPMLIGEILTAALVLFLRVTFFAGLVVPKASYPKLIEAAERVNCVTPVPDRETVCGLFVALSVMISVAVSAPGTDGVYVTLMVQEECAARLAPHVVAD
jgi:hypothetical protein